MDDSPAAQSLLPDSAAQRVEMINRQLITRGVTDPDVVDAVRAIPRELFVPAEYRERAYEDSALPVGPGQTISQPFIVAYMTQSLQIPHGGAAKVLEIGTGTGYQAAILARLAREVHTIDYDASLARLAEQRLIRLGLTNVQVHVGDGSAGWSAAAPYDRIVVTAGCPKVPAPLVEQLVPDGILVVPVGDTEAQSLLLVRRTREGVTKTPLLACRFVRLVGQYGWSE